MRRDSKNGIYLYKIEYLLHSYTTFKVVSTWYNKPIEMFLPTAQNCFWTCQFWSLLVFLPFFVLPLPHEQNIYFWGLFLSRETNKQTKDALGKIRWIGGWGTGIMLFKAKTCWSLSAVWAGVSLGNGQMCWKSLKKKSLKLNAASRNNASWYTDTDGFLKHSPSEGIIHYKGPVLQTIMVIFWVSPHIQHLTL